MKSGMEKNLPFEKALERLETIVEEMEAGNMSLEKMMKHFEEGMELVAYCSKKLNEVEKKIEILLKKGEEITTEPFTEKEADEKQDEIAKNG
jgi:exodeoxyribonuclease VII small subunit